MDHDRKVSAAVAGGLATALLALCGLALLLAAPLSLPAQAQYSYDHFAYLPLILNPEGESPPPSPSPTPVPWGVWQQGGGTDDVRFYCLAVASDGVVYAGGASGVYRSTDQGQTWQARGLAGQGVKALLAISGTTDLYAGVSYSGVYHSPDGGGTWTARNEGLNCLDVTALVVQPGEPATIYAGLYGAPGVARTTDGGAHWQDRGQGLPGLPLVLSLAADPGHPDTLYAGESAAVYRTTNGGGEWNACQSSPLDWYDGLILDPADAQVLYAGQRGDWLGWPTGYRSPDGGTTWETLPRGGVWAWGPDGLYCGTTEGVWRSADEGQSWTAWNENLGDLDVRGLLYAHVVLPAHTGGYAGHAQRPVDCVYAATDDGVWRRCAGAVAR